MFPQDLKFQKKIKEFRLIQYKKYIKRRVAVEWKTDL